MALQIIRAAPPSVSAFVSDRRLCLTADRTRVVEENTAEAAYLLVAAGAPIAAVDAERFGLTMVDDRVVLVAPEPPPAAPQVKRRAASGAGG